MYSKSLPELVSQFVSYKKANGYQYETGAYYLKKYVRFVMETAPETAVPDKAFYFQSESFIHKFFGYTFCILPSPVNSPCLYKRQEQPDTAFSVGQFLLDPFFTACGRTVQKSFYEFLRKPSLSHMLCQRYQKLVTGLVMYKCLF